MIKAVFFDFDGVICDSELLHSEMSFKFFKEEHINVSKEEVYKSIGANRKMNTLYEIYLNHQNEISYDYDTLRAKKTAFRKTYSDFNYGTIMFEGVRETIISLREKGYKTALASSSPPLYLDKNIKDCNLQGMFDFIISGESLKESKPNPEIYNRCLEHFNLNPDEAVIIEDSPYGILAGKNAGCAVIAIKDYRFGLDQRNADFCTDKITEIPDIINRLK